jgi:hypothetical protein
MAKFECPSCGYLLVDVRSCSECGKSVRQSVADWRDRSNGFRWPAFALTGFVAAMMSLPFWFVPLLSLIRDHSYIDYRMWRLNLLMTAHIAALVWPAWRVLAAGRDRLPLWRVTAPIPLSAIATGFVMVVIWVVVTVFHGPRYGPGPPMTLVLPALLVSLIVTPLLVGWLAAGLVRRVTRVASWQAALSAIREPESSTPASPAAAGAAQAKPGESGDSV